MRAFVTGSSGHLGEALVRTLKERGDEVVGLDVKASAHTDRVGSVADVDAVRACAEGADVILHTATLHKPHVATHSMSQFVETNVQGTLTLLEEAERRGIPLVFTSTTSVFGDAMRPPADAPAVWVTEDLVPVPRNIYGVTKTAAEDLCRLFHRKRGVDVLVLRTSRFFPEDDDDRAMREAYPGDNAKTNEFLFRRVAVEDVVSAHLCAAERAGKLGFGRYIISAPSPFRPEDLPELRRDAPAVLRRRVPEHAAIYADRGWRMFDGIDRVYASDAAVRDLGWQPRFTYAHVLERVARGLGPLGDLADVIGAKGYHDEVFEDGPYPIEGGS